MPTTPPANEGAGLPSQMNLPILAIRNDVIFPVLAFPIKVGRDKSLQSVNQALEGGMLLGILAQKEKTSEDPPVDDLYATGTVVKILKHVKISGDKLHVIIQGLARFKVRRWVHTDPYLRAEIDVFEEPTEHPAELNEKISTLRELAQRIIDLSPQISSDASFLVRSIDNPGVLADVVASNLGISFEEKQELLDTLETPLRMDKVITLLNKEIQVLELSNKIQSEVKGEMDRAQREYFLREQLKAIQKELGESDDRQEEFEDLKKKIKLAGMPQEVEKVAVKELKRMARMSPGAAEFTVSRTYIDWLIELPWKTSTPDNLDIARAEAILNEDHYDLEKVKTRILEYLAVRKLKNDMKGPILCLVGPPGVGKTSLAKSVARALGRNYYRIALGGVRDEAEIRGHRRTYIGSLPGKVIKGMKKAGSNNPVFVLDEIDKLGADYRGDPSSALLEVLDPEQNDTFVDHYLDVPFDLSKVLFIATANQAHPIPGPLRDRMEIIEIPGYTMEDKVKIAKSFIIPEQMEEHGITGNHCEMTDAATRFLIESYTREAGVRSLKREVAGVMRWVAKEVAAGKLTEKLTIEPAQVEKIRGPIKYFSEVAERTSVSGVATGLAWTATGGDILFIEATKMRGKGQMKLSGSLGDVMKESVGVANSYVRSAAAEFGIDEDAFDKVDIHIHVPSGAIPKDGPSAGVTMLTAIVSLLTGLTVNHQTAMTGEATLRGAVLPVGGIKEKVLAAHRAGIKRVILPEKNRKDLPDVPEEVQAEMEFHFCARMEQVLRLALGEELLEAHIAKYNEEQAAKKAAAAPAPAAAEASPA
ncbi:MAG: endopeptidase La [Deltaproteobacteria bacterium]|nr:endopeptidase La [Deltaproteobacteria bacterium]